MKDTKVTSMTEAEIQSATAALVELRRQMTFVLPLTPAERLATRILNNKPVQTAQMRAAAAREHRDALPPSFDLRAFEHEVAVLTALDGCLMLVNQLQADLRDTFLIVGKGALQTSKIAFGHIQVVAQAGGDLNRVVKHLKVRTRKPKREAAPDKNASAASAGAAGTSATPPKAPPSPVVPPAAADAGTGDKAA